MLEVTLQCKSVPLHYTTFIKGSTYVGKLSFFFLARLMPLCYHLRINWLIPKLSKVLVAISTEGLFVKILTSSVAASATFTTGNFQSSQVMDFSAHG